MKTAAAGEPAAAPEPVIPTEAVDADGTDPVVAPAEEATRG